MVISPHTHSCRSFQWNPPQNHWNMHTGSRLAGFHSGKCSSPAHCRRYSLRCHQYTHLHLLIQRQEHILECLSRSYLSPVSQRVQYHFTYQCMCVHQPEGKIQQSKSRCSCPGCYYRSLCTLQGCYMYTRQSHLHIHLGLQSQRQRGMPTCPTNAARASTSNLAAQKLLYIPIHVTPSPDSRKLAAGLQEHRKLFCTFTHSGVHPESVPQLHGDETSHSSISVDKRKEACHCSGQHTTRHRSQHQITHQRTRFDLNSAAQIPSCRHTGMTHPSSHRSLSSHLYQPHIYSSHRSWHIHLHLRNRSSWHVVVCFVYQRH